MVLPGIPFNFDTSLQSFRVQYSLLIVVLADRPFDFDTSAKVKIIARECSLARGAQEKKRFGLRSPRLKLFGAEMSRNRCGAVKAFISDHTVVRYTGIPKPKARLYLYSLVTRVTKNKKSAEFNRLNSIVQARSIFYCDNSNIYFKTHLDFKLQSVGRPRAYNGGCFGKKNKVKEELAHAYYSQKPVEIGMKVCITNDADKRRLLLARNYLFDRCGYIF